MVEHNLRQIAFNNVYEILNKGFIITFFVVIFNILFSLNINAQNIKQTKDVLSTLDSKKSERLNSLMYDLQTTIYLENSEMKVIGDGAPVYIKTDIASINKLNEKNSKFSNVELLEVYLTVEGQESKITITPELVSSISNLKYILVKSEYQLKAERFEKIFSGFINSNIVLIYEVSIPR
jgi:hypothetical protein